eukprot:TRINITY_DN36374_c0_g1_i1.p1 TRINITY_DN36374_c0_g1~~TRINITY_DN36374_c0_g1_i1.p1  ORF type:complete len:175 (+),score=9.66 TRINITY_DN36374_c0_g1_i1:83-607(+)
MGSDMRYAATSHCSVCYHHCLRKGRQLFVRICLAMSSFVYVHFLSCALFRLLPSAKAQRALSGDSCPSNEVRSESGGICIEKPWSDFLSCEDEAGQAACWDNDWVVEHCVETCKGTGSIPSFGTIMFFIGPVIGVCVLGCLICGLVYWCRKRRSRPDSQSPANVQEIDVVGRGS